MDDVVGAAESKPVAESATSAIRVLIVDDEPEVGRVTRRILAGDGMAVDLEQSPEKALHRMENDREWDVIVMDIGMPVISGIDLLKRHRALGLTSSVIMLSADNTAGTAAKCLRGGALNYLTKPVNATDLIAMVQSAAYYTELRRRLSVLEHKTDQTLIGRSSTMGRLHAAIQRLAESTVSVLIQGESGTGKELVARSLHDASPRRKGPFVALNCGAIPEGLIDSELFGHSRGAFTGATATRPGVFVEADGGTLFLDEIGEMPVAVQARLLRVLQEGEIRQVGASGVRAVDVRVVAATHVDLEAAVEQGRFRQDLYYRLDDLPLLVAHFLKKHCGATTPALSPEALDVLLAYPWPGNIRELENALLHAIALTRDGVIDVSVLPPRLTKRDTAVPSVAVEDVDIEEGVTLTEAKRRAGHEFERRFLLRVLEQSKGSVSEASRLSGLDRANFRRLMQKHGIDATRFKS